MNYSYGIALKDSDQRESCPCGGIIQWPPCSDGSGYAERSDEYARCWYELDHSMTINI
jgi:hypothetical protein